MKHANCLFPIAARPAHYLQQFLTAASPTSTPIIVQKHSILVITDIIFSLVISFLV